MTDQMNNISAETLDDLNGRFLTFYIGKSIYGVELSHVLEIISIEPITRVPRLPNYLKGIVNLRGKVVPVIDVRTKFRLEERAYDDKTCIIVVTVDGMQVGLIADSVAEVITVPNEEQSAPPDLGSGDDERYLRSIAKVGGNVILNIDCDKFFRTDLQLY